MRLLRVAVRRKCHRRGRLVSVAFRGNRPFWRRQRRSLYLADPEWKNLFLISKSCSRAKRSLFPVEGERAQLLTPQDEIDTAERSLLIDPCNDDPTEHLRFVETGAVQSLSRKGEVTIKLLKMNRDDLIAARSQAWLQASLDGLKISARSVGQAVPP